MLTMLRGDRSASSTLKYRVSEESMKRIDGTVPDRIEAATTALCSPV